MKHLVLALAIASPAFLSGCVISVGGDGDSHYSADWEDRQYNNRKHISKLTKGSAYESIVARMGIADFDEFVQGKDGEYRVLYYRTQRTSDDGMTTKDECTPLVFEGEKLVGWGDSALMNL